MTIATNTADTITPGLEKEAPVDHETKAWAGLMEEMAEDDLSPSAIDDELTSLEGKLPAEAKPDVVKPEPTPAELKAQVDNLNKALRGERAKTQSANQRLTNYDEFIRQLREGRQQQKAEPVKEEPKQPDIDEDPVGHFKHEIQKLHGVIQNLQQGTQQTAQQLQAQGEEQRFWGDVERSEIEERKSSQTFTVEVDGKKEQVSDYDLACRHLESTRIAELEHMLPDESPQAIAYARQLGAPSVAAVRAHMLNQDRVAVARHAMALGMSPAKLYFTLAKQRGYQSPQLQTPQDQGKQQLAAIKRGQQAAKTLSGGGGGKQTSDMNLDDLSDLYAEDPDEFDKQWERMAKAGRLG